MIFWNKEISELVVYMNKFNIVCVEADYKTSIIETFKTHMEANEALTILVNANFKKQDEQGYYKVYDENLNEKTVKYIGYLKSYLHAKYFIIEFNDKTYENISKV